VEERKGKVGAFVLSGVIDIWDLNGSTAHILGLEQFAVDPTPVGGGSARVPVTYVSVRAFPLEGGNLYFYVIGQDV
jgi:hypothetical protein